MPSYEFQCRDCRKTFEVVETFAEHDKHQEKCPKCGGKNVEQRMSNVRVKTSRKS